MKAKQLHTLSIGLVSAVSASFLSAYDGCYDFCGPDCGTFGVRAEYLYWTTKVCDLDYARETVEVLGTLDEPISLLEDKIHRMGHKWRSGFKIGADYQCSYNDPWRYSLVYSYYRSRNSSKTRLPEEPIEVGQARRLRPTIEYIDNGLFPLGMFDVPVDILDAAKARTRFRLDLGDLEIVRTNALCGPACFNVLLGIRGGYLSNRWSVKYRYPDQIDSTASLTDIKSCLDNHWRYSAFGPRVGGQFDWCLGYGFSIYIDTSLTALWGKSRNRVFVRSSGVEAVLDAEATEVSAIFENIDPHCYKVVLVADAEGGLGFIWTCESFAVTGKVAAQLIHFNSLVDNQFHRFPTGYWSFSRRNGNLDLFGLTAGLGVNF